MARGVTVAQKTEECRRHQCFFKEINMSIYLFLSLDEPFLSFGVIEFMRVEASKV